MLPFAAMLALALPPPRPEATMPTPRPALTFCRGNPLLRPICPRRVPRPRGRQEWFCDTGAPRESVRESTAGFPTRRCGFALWAYQGFTGGHLNDVQVAAWRRSARISMGGGRVVSAHWLRWHGRWARLLRAPPHECSEWGDVELYLPPNAAGISYSITLQAWPPVRDAVATLRALASAA
jgi:hypothetical protein